MTEEYFAETVAVLLGPAGNEERSTEHRCSGVMIPGPRAAIGGAAAAAVDAAFVYAWHKGWIPDPVKAVVTVINLGISVLVLVVNAPGFFRDLFKEFERRPYDRRRDDENTMGQPAVGAAPLGLGRRFRLSTWSEGND